MTVNETPTLATLAQLRKAAGLSQDEAGARLGLTGAKRRTSVSDWETGKSQPGVKHRADFVAYLLDVFRLRRDPERMARLWTHIMMATWGWRPLSKEDLRRYYPGGIPDVLLPGNADARLTVASVVHAPPAPAIPPKIEQLIDRPTKRVQYIEQLIAQHIAAIVGMPGVGKTSLASMVAQQAAQPKRIFWHSFRSDTDATNLLWKLAGFLYWAGEEWPWIWLQNSSQGHGQPPNTTMLLDTMIDLMLRRDYLVCLDDFQQVETDVLVQEVGRRFREAAHDRAISLIVSARSLPGFLQGMEFEPLRGMSWQETRQLFIGRRMPPLGGALLERLHNRTEGNPQLLDMVIVAIRQGEDPEHLAGALEQIGEVAGYVFDQVDTRLSSTDRQVMIAVALLDPAATRGAIEAVLPGQSVTQSLIGLERQHLLYPEQRDIGRVYSQHATVHAYYLRATSFLERQELHGRAARYFRFDVNDWLHAARHYQEAGDYGSAAHLATLDVWRLINQGRARELAQILDRFTPDRLGFLDWAAVGVGRGNVAQFLHDSIQAYSSYQSALDTLAQVDRTQAVVELRVRALLGQSDLLFHQSLPDALDRLRDGIAELGDADSPERAELLIKIGTVSMMLGKHQDALNAVRQGLNLLPDTPDPLRMRGLITQGAVYSSQGDVAQGHRYTLQALQIAEQMQDRFRMLSILSNSGLENGIIGKWEDAEADFHRALGIARQIGSLGEEAKLSNNLGVLYTDMGRLGLALEHLERAYELAADLDLNDLLPYVLTSLGDLHIRREDWAAAEAFLEKAEQITQRLETPYPLPEAYFLRSQVYRAIGRMQDALDLAQRAIELARELDLALEEGKAWRAVGQILLAQRQTRPAIDAFQHSLDLLSNQNAYEAARTKVQWGLALLQEARTVFAAYNAELDLTGIGRILRPN